MSINTELKRTVSPTLHPANITGLVGYEPHRKYIAHATEAMDTAYQAIDHVMEARAKLALDASRTPKARILMAAQMAEKYMTQIQKKFECSWDRLTAGIDHTENELSTPLEEYAGIGNVATEIRAHLKSMSSGDRMSFLADSLDRDDERTLKSVLGAPAYLSGMTGIEQAHVTRNYHAKKNPEMAKRVEVMKLVLEKLERARPIVLIEMEKAVGVTRLELEKLKAASSEAEAALVLKDFGLTEN